MGEYTKQLEILSKNGNKQEQAAAKALSKTEGGNLKYQDLKDLLKKDDDWIKANVANKDLDELLNEDSALRQVAQELFNGSEELKSAYNDDFNLFYESDFLDAVIPTTDLFINTLKDDLGSAIKNLSLDGESSKLLFDKFTANFAGLVKPEQFLPDFDKILESSEDADEFIKALTSIDFRNQRDLDNFSTTLQQLGIIFDREALDEYITNLGEAAEALPQIDMSKFVENTQEFAKVINDINSGKQTRKFSKDIYDKLISANLDGINASDFAADYEGNYVYLGNKLDNIVTAIQKQTQELLGEGTDQLQAKADAFDIARSIKISDTKTLYSNSSSHTVEVEKTQAEKELEYMQAVQAAYKERTGKLGIDDFYEKTNLAILGEASIHAMYQKFLKIASNPDQYQSQYDEAKTVSNISTAIGSGVEGILNEFQKYTSVVGGVISTGGGGAGANRTPAMAIPTRTVSTELTEDDKKHLLEQINGLMTLALSNGVSEDVVAGYSQQMNNAAQQNDVVSLITMGTELGNLISVYRDFIDKGYDVEVLDQVIDKIKTIHSIERDAASVAVKINKNLNEGVKKLIDNSDTFDELFGDNGPLGKGKDIDLKILNEDQYEKIQVLKETLEEAFGVEDIPLNFLADPETEELLNALIYGTSEEKEKAAQELNWKLHVEIDKDQYNEAVQDFIDNTMYGYQMPDLEIGAKLNDDPFVDSLQNLLDNTDLTVDELQKLLNGMNLQAEMTTKRVWAPWSVAALDEDGLGPNGMTGHFIEVPEIKYLFKTGSSNNLLNNYNKETQGKGNKSKSSSDSKKKNWKNPYDELYNLQEHINSALREREKLEAKYQRMLEDHRTVGEDLQKQSLKEIASLQKQLYYQKQMMAGREKQMANVLNETYEDGEGNRKTYGSMGLQKYAWYEEDTQTVHIEWDKINQVTDEDQGKAIEAYVSRLEELRDQMQDVEDAIDEANDQIREIQMRNTEEYIDFEQRVYDALVNQYQREIDMLGEINQSVTDATNKTLDAISEEIEKERQARENEKAREELSDKEARLAYLQRDTSGMNALEIQKLQQELENERQSYQDSIVDQTLQEMRDEAARAEAQRQAQIDMMQGQLDWWQEVGYPLWEQVETLMNTGVDNTGKIISDSALDKLLTANDNVAAMSKIAAFKWTQDLAKEVAAQFEGKANWMMEMARDAGEAIDAKGKKYKYKASENKWYDENENEVNVYYRNGEYVAEKIEKPKEVPVGNGGQQPGGGGTQTPPQTLPQTPPQTPPPETVLSDYDKKAFAALYLAGYYNQESLANEIGKNNAGQSISYGHGNYYLYDLFTQAVGGNTKWQSNNSWKKYMKGNTTWKKYAQGGLADFTGPAWLDGTKSHPEMVLNATDTQNLITLKNILGAILQNATSTSKTSTGDNYFDINIDANISSDYDVDQLSERIKKQIYEDSTYRNVNTIHYIR